MAQRMEIKQKKLKSTSRGKGGRKYPKSAERKQSGAQKGINCVS